MRDHVLVVGARPNSLGYHVANELRAASMRVTTGGVCEEDVHLDVVDAHRREEVLKMGFDHVVCTAGVNMVGTIQDEQWQFNMTQQMRLNYLGPMYLLGEWVAWVKEAHFHEGAIAEQPLRNFVAISSNSANVARSGSGGYCASKAALSMGIRCAAREQAGWPINIWGVEPGWMEGTPMSEEIKNRDFLVLHRIPSGYGVNPAKLAEGLVGLLINGGRELNGCLLRIDGGEQ